MHLSLQAADRLAQRKLQRMRARLQAVHAIGVEQPTQSLQLAWQVLT
jgi:hypothetical protein